MDSEIQNKLNKYCIINRKYNLINETEFLSQFSNIKLDYLRKAWEYSNIEIQNDEIVKNAIELPMHGKKVISDKLKKFNFDSSELYFFLNSKFNFNELRLDDERIERRLRNILAERHQKILKTEINKIKRKEKLIEFKGKIISGISIAIIPILFCGFIFGTRIRDGFTSVDVLTKRIYEREVYEFDGSVCNDGTISHSQGQGTCSWHNGVSYKFYKGEHKKTMEECRIEAKEKSWIE